MPFIVAGLAIYRISRMLTEEEGPFAVFSTLRGLFPPVNWVGRGMECVMCVSVWVALPIALYLDWAGDWPLTWLALSAITVIIRKWEVKR